MTLLTDAAAMVHGGILVTFAALLLARRRIPHVREEDLVRVFRACGALLGLSLGAYVLAWAWRWPGLYNPGAVGVDRWAVPAAQTLRVATFGAYWVSYAGLEIWTLDPCRLLDRDGVVTDLPAYAAAVGRVTRHLALNAGLFVVAAFLPA